ncbi:hypothetical protein H4582DRAFT_2062412 [Lactarius indigo]|nr:hypothetical protein H4582DRAFT_2062412 [Lactarius indigo]
MLALLRFATALVRVSVPGIGEGGWRMGGLASYKGWTNTFTGLDRCLQPSSSTPNFHPIFEKALKEYKKKTGKEISTHPLAEEINGCSSIEAILTVLQGKANELNQSQTSDERLTKWLTPTVNVLDALSSTLGEGVGTVFPPTKIIFSAMSILLVAAKGTAASRDVLIELFERIENFFVRLQTHTEVPPTTEMTNVMGKVMAEVLSMLAVATKVMNQSRKS